MTPEKSQEMEELERIVNKENMTAIEFELSDGSVYKFEDPFIVELFRSLIKKQIDRRNSSVD